MQGDTYRRSIVSLQKVKIEMENPTLAKLLLECLISMERNTDKMIKAVKDAESQGVIFPELEENEN